MKRIIKLIISLLYLPFHKIFTINSPVHSIFYFHSVYEHNKESFFDKINFIGKFSTPVNLNGMTELKKREKYFSLTFDDGFQNLLENVIPFLEKEKLPATIFIPTNYIGKVPEWEFGNEIYDKDKSEFIMTEEQIKNLNKNLFSIGSHTCSHPHLSKLEEKEIEKELRESKNILESIVGYEIEMLSFPHGDYSEKVIEIAEATGYKKMFTVIPDNTTYNDKIIGRIFVSPNERKTELWLKLNGAYNWESKFQKIKRKLRNKVNEHSL